MIFRRSAAEVWRRSVDGRGDLDGRDDGVDHDRRSGSRAAVTPFAELSLRRDVRAARANGAPAATLIVDAKPRAAALRALPGANDLSPLRG
jgi:hypothetical protein